MSQEVGGNDAPFILNAVERAITRVPRSSHHGLTKIPTVMKIAGRTYLDLSALTDIDMDQLPEIAPAARLYHLALTHQTLVATGRYALWAHGYGCDPALPPTTVSVSSAIRPIVLSAIAIDTHAFAPMKVKPRHVCHLPAISDIRGLLVENLESAQITAARTSRNRRAASTQMCMNAHTYTHFDNFHMKASRNNEESWKSFLERELKQLGNRARGRPQAQWIITHANTGCAFPGETRVPYELCVAGLVGMHVQVEVHTRGRRYLIDCAFTAERVGIEFDGRAKYEDDARSIHSSLSREHERQRHLEAEGWYIIRIGWHDLDHPDELVVQIRGVLAVRLM